MIIQIVNSYDELQDVMHSHEKVYCLLYKPGSELSACASDKLHQAAGKAKDGVLCLADVTRAKDIHPRYHVTTAPTLLVFENSVQTNQVKGCNNASFYENLINGSYFVSHTGEEKAQPNVTMYTTPTCSHCISLKSYLAKHNIKFREIDISKDSRLAEELIKQTGQQGVPQTNINGKFVIGFDQNQINQLLNLKS